MKQYEAVIKVMEENGGYATLGYLYQNTLKIKDAKWETKTPFASIRRIVQDDRFFFKIRPGLWALKTYKEDIIKKFNIDDKIKEPSFTHSFYQGLLIEIGNIKKFDTYIPPQDKNKKFLNVKLGDISSINKIHDFTYKNILRFTKTVDVIWFNNRKMPVSMFEIEHSTEMYNSLIKFVELRDFNINFRIVADESKRNTLIDKIYRAAFECINNRVNFMSYQELANEHSYEIKRSFKL